LKPGKEETEYKGFYNPFILGVELWQKSLTSWLNFYGEFVKSATKITDYWYDAYWKILSTAQQQQRQDIDKVKVE
jgi:hypothetical protein